MTVVYFNGRSTVVGSKVASQKVLDLTGPSYSKEAFAASADELIANAEKTLYGLNIDFDSMVGVGLSGLLVLPVLARHFKVPFFAVRKRGESSHLSHSYGEGSIGKKWILIDDFTCTGKTVAMAKKSVASAVAVHEFRTKYVGLYAYSDSEFHYPDNSRARIEQITYGGETVYVNADVYWRVRDLLDVALRRQMPNPKTYVLETIRTRNYGWDVDEVSMIAVALEPKMRAHLS